MANEIWLDGVKLDIGSGDVSAVEHDVRSAITSGVEWLQIQQPGWHGWIRITPSIRVIVRYDS